MAIARAIANGNWSATSTWNGGVLPSNGDTVFSNGYNITLDQDILIGGVNNPTINAGSLVAGQWYEIVNVGGQSWTSIGATSNTAGAVFQATGTGTSGSLGTARALATLTTATNTAAGATTGGGSFVMSSIRSVNCDLRAGATQCLNITATTGTVSLSGIRIIGGGASGANAINTTTSITLSSCTVTGGSSSGSGISNIGSGTINFSSSASTVSGSGSGGAGIVNAAGGAVAFSTPCTISGGSGTSAAAINNSSSSGTVLITAPCVLFGGGGTGAAAISNASSGTITITAACTITAGSSAPALNNISNGTLTVTDSSFTASSTMAAVTGSIATANVSLSGSFYDHWQGYPAIYVIRWKLGATPTAAQHRMPLAGTADSYVTFFTADNSNFGLPAASDVRLGVVFAGGIITGTCAVPPPATVQVGIPVDGTIGTAVMTAETVAAAVWGAASRTVTGGVVDTLTNAPASVTPTDIWNHTTRTLTDAPAVPSAVQIRQEMDANSTKLANLDAAVSSRLAPSGTLSRVTLVDTATTLTNAPVVPSAASIATAVWAAADKTGYSLTNAERSAIAIAVEQSILNEGDGQAVLNAIVGAIGNQSVDQIALVAAIRSDLERAGGKIDSISSAPTVTQIRQEMDANSTRLEGLDTRISAIKEKTDSLPLQRLSNVATSEIVGALISQALNEQS